MIPYGFLGTTPLVRDDSRASEIEVSRQLLPQRESDAMPKRQSAAEPAGGRRSRPARILVAVTGVPLRSALERGRAFSQPARDLLLSADSAKHRDWIPHRRAAAEAACSQHTAAEVHPDARASGQRLEGAAVPPGG